MAHFFLSFLFLPALLFQLVRVPHLVHQGAPLNWPRRAGIGLGPSGTIQALPNLVANMPTLATLPLGGDLSLSGAKHLTPSLLFSRAQ